MDNSLTVEDKLAMADVLTRYASGIDRRDWDLFKTCFTDDFSGEYGYFGRWTSAEEITQAMISSHAEVGATLHRLSNMDVAATASGRATARTYVDAILMPLKPGGTVHQVTGFYDDELVKHDSEWKIARRSFILVRFQQAVEPPFPA